VAVRSSRQYSRGQYRPGGSTAAGSDDQAAAQTTQLVMARQQQQQQGEQEQQQVSVQPGLDVICTAMYCFVLLAVGAGQ